MARYLLQDLIFVREHREDKASKAVTMARRVVVEAEQLVARREKELEDYKVWRQEEEIRKLDSIMLKPVKLGDITDMRLEIAGMREKELDFIDLLRKAEGDLDKAREALEVARKAHIKATQELEKLVEHRELWRQEQSLEEERLADLELEDFISPKKNLLALTGTQNHEYN
ncbi:MAG: type III secretion protein [Verrucomicrobium sp.]|nr:type III secretion protein [Verrucomicrobium sp.]